MADTQTIPQSKSDDVHVHDNVYSDWASVVRKGHAHDEHPLEDSEDKANVSPQQATIERGVGILPGQVERTLETQDAHASDKNTQKGADQKAQEEPKQAQKEAKLPTKDEKTTPKTEDKSKEQQNKQTPEKQNEKVQSVQQLEKKADEAKAQAKPDEKKLTENPVAKAEAKKPEEKAEANNKTEVKQEKKAPVKQEEKKGTNKAENQQPAARSAKQPADKEQRSGEAHPHVNWEPLAEAVEQAYGDEMPDTEPAANTPPFGAQGEHDPYGEMTDYERPDAEEMGGSPPPHACPSCQAPIGDEDTICQSCQQPLPGIQPSDTFCSACQTISDSEEGGDRGCPECARVSPQYCDQCSGEYEMPNLEGDEGTVSTRQIDEYNNAPLRHNTRSNRSSGALQGPHEFYDPTGQDVIIRIGHQPRPWGGEEFGSGEGFWYKVAQELMRERAQQEGTFPQASRQTRQALPAPRRSRPTNFAKGQPAQEQPHSQQHTNAGQQLSSQGQQLSNQGQQQLPNQSQQLSSQGQQLSNQGQQQQLPNQSQQLPNQGQQFTSQGQQLSNRDQPQSREQPHQEQSAKRDQPARDQQTMKNDQLQARQPQGGQAIPSRQATENRMGQDTRRPLGQENLRRESWGQGQQQTQQRGQAMQARSGQQQALHQGNPLLDVQHFFGALLWWVVCLAVAVHHICTHLPAFWANALTHARQCYGKASELAKESAEKLKNVGKPSEWHLPVHFGEQQNAPRSAPVASQ